MTSSRIDELRRACATPPPHPAGAALDADARLALDHALGHFATLRDHPVGRARSRQELEALLGEPPPEVGRPFTEVLDAYRDRVEPFAFRVAHPRFLAFIPSAPTFYSVLGDLLCSATNFFGSVWLEAAGPSQVELVVLEWFRGFLGLPCGSGGLLTSGGSEANLTALVTARERLAPGERERAVLYLSGERHWSVDRAARIMGLRAEQCKPLPPDEHFHLTPARLAVAVAADRAAGLVPWAVVANAGATNTGAVDPLADLADVCTSEGLWLHVDAAYGWAAALTAQGTRDLDGIARADSVTLDPHKWFAQTFEAGCLLVRDVGLLERTFASRPDYMADVEPEGEDVNFADRGLALTRRFRALKIWLSVKTLGVGWYRGLVEHCYRLADLGQALLEATGSFEILSPRRLSIVCFRYRPPGVADERDIDRANRTLLDALRRSGQAFLSTTRLHGRMAMRFCFINWRTTAADVEAVVNLLVALTR